MKIVIDSKDVIKKLKLYDPNGAGHMIYAPAGVVEDLMRKFLDKYIAASNMNEKVGLALDIVDKITDVTRVREYAVCQKGCAYCCSIPVAVTRVEAEYIKNYIDENEVKLSNVDYSLDNKYCPFLCLDTATCSIYEARPLNCRTFFSLDHYDYCKDNDSMHLIVSAKSNEQIKAVLGALSIASHHEVLDIRECFENIYRRSI